MREISLVQFSKTEEFKSYKQQIINGDLTKIKLQPFVGLKVIAMIGSGLNAICVTEVLPNGFIYSVLNDELEKMAISGFSPAPQFYAVL